LTDAWHTGAGAPFYRLGLIFLFYFEPSCTINASISTSLETQWMHAYVCTACLDSFPRWNNLILEVVISLMPGEWLSVMTNFKPKATEVSALRLYVGILMLIVISICHVERRRQSAGS